MIENTFKTNLSSYNVKKRNTKKTSILAKLAMI